MKLLSRLRRFIASRLWNTTARSGFPIFRFPVSPSTKVTEVHVCRRQSDEQSSDKIPEQRSKKRPNPRISFSQVTEGKEVVHLRIYCAGVSYKQDIPARQTSWDDKWGWLTSAPNIIPKGTEYILAMTRMSKFSSPKTDWDRLGATHHGHNCMLRKSMQINYIYMRFWVKFPPSSTHHDGEPYSNDL